MKRNRQYLQNQDPVSQFDMSKLTLADLSNTAQAAKKKQAYDEMLRSGRSLRAQEAFMREQGFKISRATLWRTKDKIEKLGDTPYKNEFLIKKKRKPAINFEKKLQIDSQFNVVLGHISLIDQGVAGAYRWLETMCQQTKEPLVLKLSTAYRRWNNIPEASRPRIAKDNEDHFTKYGAQTRNLLLKPDDCWQIDEWMKIISLSDKHKVTLYGVSVVDESTEFARAIRLFCKPINRVCLLNTFAHSLKGNKELGIPTAKPKMIRFDNAKIHEPDLTNTEQPLRVACALLNIEVHHNHNNCPREDAKVENNIGNLKRISIKEIEYYLKEVLKIETYADWVAHADCIQQKLDDFITFWNLKTIPGAKQIRMDEYLYKREETDVTLDEIDYAVRYIKRVKLQQSGIRHDEADYQSPELTSKVGQWVELRLRPECNSPDIDVYYEGKFLARVKLASDSPHLKYELNTENRRVRAEQQMYEKALKDAFKPLYIQKLLDDPKVSKKEKVRIMEVLAEQNSKSDSAVDKSEDDDLQTAEEKSVSTDTNKKIDSWKVEAL